MWFLNGHKGEKNFSRGEKEPRHRCCTRGSSSSLPLFSVQRPDGCRASDGHRPNCGATLAKLDQGGVMSQLLHIYMSLSRPEVLPSTPSPVIRGPPPLSYVALVP